MNSCFAILLVLGANPYQPATTAESPRVSASPNQLMLIAAPAAPIARGRQIQVMPQQPLRVNQPLTIQRPQVIFTPDVRQTRSVQPAGTIRQPQVVQRLYVQPQMMQQPVVVQQVPVAQQYVAQPIQLIQATVPPMPYDQPVPAKTVTDSYPQPLTTGQTATPIAGDAGACGATCCNSCNSGCGSSCGEFGSCLGKLCGLFGNSCGSGCGCGCDEGNACCGGSCDEFGSCLGKLCGLFGNKCESGCECEEEKKRYRCESTYDMPQHIPYQPAYHGYYYYRPYNYRHVLQAQQNLLGESRIAPYTSLVFEQLYAQFPKASFNPDPDEEAAEDPYVEPAPEKLPSLLDLLDSGSDG